MSKDIPDIWICGHCGADMRDEGLITWQSGQMRQDITVTVDDDGEVSADYDAFDDSGDSFVCIAIQCGSCEKTLPTVQEWAVGEMIGDPIHQVSRERLHEDQVLQNWQFRCTKCGGVFEEGGDHQSIDDLCANCADIAWADDEEDT